MLETLQNGVNKKFSSFPEVFCKKGEACNFIKKETPRHVFFYEFGEKFKETFL